MFRRKRDDTTVAHVEDKYGICLNCRRDTLLGNLLDYRGFQSLSQLLEAYYGRATSHARKRRCFLSFHYEDRQQVSGFRLMVKNPAVAIELRDTSLDAAIRSGNDSYVRRVLRERIQSCEVVVCLIGNGTAWREWVDFELESALDLGKGLCGVRLKGAVGRAPEILRDEGAPVARWNFDEMIAAIECAAARRS